MQKEPRDSHQHSLRQSVVQHGSGKSVYCYWNGVKGFVYLAPGQIVDEELDWADFITDRLILFYEKELAFDNSLNHSSALKDAAHTIKDHKYSLTFAFQLHICFHCCGLTSRQCTLHTRKDSIVC